LCFKFQVGAPQDIADLFEGIKEEHSGLCQISESKSYHGFLGADPELDDFMVSFSSFFSIYI